MNTKPIKKFIKLESASGIILLFVLILSLLIANSPLVTVYDGWLHTPIQIQFGQFEIDKPLFLWVNDGLMAIFFLLLALELKREVLEGELSSKDRVILPTIAAVGGIVFPALIYIAFNYHDPAKLIGWPIPIATDVAFVLGIIAILGKRVPASIKAFIVALSIVDDVLAIAIIAIFYTSKLSYISLALSSMGVVLLILFNFFGVKRIAAYMVVGVFIWVCVLKSGIHATLAGVVVGLLVPLHHKDKENHLPAKPLEYSPLRYLEHNLHPWVAFAILPIFVFVNGGVTFRSADFIQLFNTVPLGIILGLVVGKACGVFGTSYIAIKLGFCRSPSRANTHQFFAASILTGVGFTMSLFLSSLSFADTAYASLSRQGILIGSGIACLIGVIYFVIASAKKSKRSVTYQQPE